MIVRLAAEAMATRFELVLSGEDEFLLRAAGEQALAAIEDEHRRLNLFDPSSLIARVNAGAALRPVPVDRDLYDLLALCGRLRIDTEGAFNPAVGALMRRWGHRGPPRPDRPTTEPEPIRLDPHARTVAFTSPDLALDLGGIAKGYALDRAGAILRDAGVRCALLHGGTSSIVVIGAPPGQDGWRVRLARVAPGVPTADLVLCDAAASISAPAGRVSETGAGHIVDPRTGQPAMDVLAAVTVGASGALAEAWSTALVVLAHRPDTMPPELGSALCAGAGWDVSPSLRPLLRSEVAGSEVECIQP